MNDSTPTQTRHLVVGATALMAVILYFHRFCISFAEIFIKEELGLSDKQIAWILSCFFLTYALGQVPSGWLTDRFGARIMLTLYILFWSVFTGLTGAAYAFVMLILFRAGFGFAQAGAYPTSANLISKWVPFTSRGKASSVVAMGGRIGGALAPLVTGYLIVMLVPISVSSKLDQGDLLNVQRLSHEIMYGSDSLQPPASSDKDNAAARLGQRLRDLSPQLESTIQPLAADYESALAKKRADKSNENAKSLAATLDPSDAATLEKITSLLNKIIARDDLYDKKVFHEVVPEKQAQRLLAKQESGKQLSSDETVRLNRLLLEAVYRQSIRKVYGSGWRRMMMIYGIAGLVIAGIFWFTCRNRPQDHPRVNEAELDLIQSSRSAKASQPDGKVGAVPMKWILRSRSLWLSSISQFMTNVGWVILVTWAPRYYQSAHGVGVETRAWMVFVPTMIGWFGMMSGGWLTDRLVNIVGLRWGRALPMGISRFIATAAYLVCLLQWDNPWVVVAMFSIVAFSTDLGTSATWAFTQDVGGRNVGSILGWGNMWGNLGAFVATRYLISLVGEDENWNLVFITCAAAFFLSGIAALGINATIPVVPEDDKETADDADEEQ